MGSRTYGLLLLALATTPLPQCLAGEEGPDAYEIAAAATVPVLPSPLRAFFEPHLAALQSAAVDERCRQADCDGRHHLMLDAAARGTDQAARHEAASNFPQNRRRAKRLFVRNETATGGSLPWTVVEAYRDLVNAFRERNVAAIVAATGVLCHYTCDAAFPFQVGRAGIDSDDLRDRVQTKLIAQLRNRLDYEVRVAPSRYHEATAPLVATFATMIEAHATLVTLMEADAEFTGTPSETPSAAKTDGYYDRMMERTADVMETRLEGAALLAANLIGGAWAEAGRPALGHDSELATDAAEDPSTSFVGSRASTLFHRPNCQHARRIKPENRTHFPTAATAFKAGRKSCKTCKPGLP